MTLFCFPSSVPLILQIGSISDMASSSTLPTERSGMPSASVVSQMENFSIIKPSHEIEDLRKNPNLWYKIHVLLYDLRNFGEVKESHDRLEKVADASYIGMPYFSTDEVKILKSTAVNISKPAHNWKSTTVNSQKGKDSSGERKTLDIVIEEELRERLERRMKKREQSGDFRVCAAHDIAPILEKAFGIDPKQLSKDQTFLDLMTRSQLKLKEKEDWNGLPKKTFGKRGKRL
ncbi:hypothetical protein BKA64DRAFT_160720 [Cadophora sp. MPI-SDFR-AT-0126]|nr:hypothetical protein BKA64DRAFT_160720 [Leotiomycetes sp. MPI-SDFR-AT-0126]